MRASSARSGAPKRGGFDQGVVSKISSQVVVVVLSFAHGRFHPKTYAFLLVGQPRRFIAQNEKGFGMLARNLPGIRSELRVCSESARKTVRTSHARNCPCRGFLLVSA